jgi:hypothetical protein
LALREVLANFGFGFDGAKVRQADGLIRGLESKVAALTGAFAAIGAVRWLQDMAAQLDVIDDLSAQLKVGTDQLQLWGFAAGQNGSSAEEMNRSLELLNKSLGMAEGEGKTQAEVFKRMGVQVRDAAGEIRPMGELLNELPAGFAGLSSDAEKARVATVLFGRSGARLVPLLEQGEEGMAKLRAEFERLGGGATPEAIKAAGEYRDQIAKMDLAFFGLKSRIVSQVFPALMKVVDVVSGAVATFTKWSEGSTAASSAVYAIAAAITGALLPAILPMLPALAAFLAAFLVFDDFKAFFEGNDSLVGRALESWFGKENTDKIRNFFRDAIGEFQWFLARFGDGSEEMKASWADDWDILVEGIRTGDMFDKWHEWLTAAAVESDDFIIGVTAGFVDGLAYIAQLFANLVYEFATGFEKTQAFFSGMTDGIGIMWGELMVQLAKEWNSLVESLNIGGIFDGLKADVQGKQDALGSLRRASAARHDAATTAKLPNNAIAGQPFQVPTSITGGAVSIGEVTIVASPGEKVGAAAARGVGPALGNANRSAAQALVPVVSR